MGIMACEPPNRAGNPDQEPFSGWGTLPEGPHSITDSRQLQLATPLPQLSQQQHLYHLPALLDPPPPPAPNQGYTLPYNSTGGAYMCVSPTATQQPEQLPTASSLYKCPVDGSTTLSDRMELDDNSEFFPLSLIESSQDDIFAQLSPLLPPLPQHQSASVPPVGDETPLHDLSSPFTFCGNSPPVQLVPSLESSKKSEQSESSASDSVPLLSVGHSESSVIPPGAFIPPSSPLPGDYGFKLHFAKCGTNTSWTFSEALNTLFVKPGDDFAVTFKFATPPPPQCFVRAMVCYGDPVHIQKLGVVTVTPHRDKGGKDSDHSDHFLHCKVPQALYGEHHAHKCVTVAMDTLPMSEWGPFCVYSYACYSGHIVGAGKNKPSLKTIFSVIQDGNEIARDVVMVKCRACPSRDLHKELHGRSKQRVKPGRCPSHGLQKDLHDHPKRQANPDTDPTGGTPRSKRQRRLATDTTTSAVLPQGDDGPPPPLTLPPSSLPLPPTLTGVGVHGVDLVKDEEPDDEGYYNFVWRLKDRGLYNMLLMLRTGYTGCK